MKRKRTFATKLFLQTNFTLNFTFVLYFMDISRKLIRFSFSYNIYCYRNWWIHSSSIYWGIADLVSDPKHKLEASNVSGMSDISVQLVFIESTANMKKSGTKIVWNDLFFNKRMKLTRVCNNNCFLQFLESILKRISKDYNWANPYFLRRNGYTCGGPF